MTTSQDISKISNWINGQEAFSATDAWIEKFNPHTGQLMAHITDSSPEDVNEAITAATAAAPEWAALTPVRRGQYLTDLVNLMKTYADTIASCIAVETGKPPQDAKGETGGAIMQAEYFAGEGMRLYARSLTSGMPGKYSHTVRCPRGVAGLIVPANTPIANIAWKTFPALICGNTIVMKAAEDSPEIGLLFAKLTKEAGLPDGVFNVIQGGGRTAGAPLVEDPRIDVISFTGSTAVGRWIAEQAGKRLARVSLELGGSNPFVVCDDADIDKAVHWASLSAFSNAGQRCASGSRLIIFRSIYEEFRDKLVTKANSLKLGVDSDSDLGPVVNKRQHDVILRSIETAQQQGGKVLCGGAVSGDSDLANGYYIQPTLIEGLEADADLCRNEVFGPIATMHVVDNLQEALALANATQYGLTAAIHSTNVDRAMWFAQNVRAGVANINLGTYGSEPHMPFGGFGASGNGSREPGVEALDVYSELKNISFLVREDEI